MAWDVMLDPSSGDFIFSPSTDLLGATGDVLTKQRILTRCRIPRGTFVYDSDDELGSRLHTIHSIPSDQQKGEAPPLAQEALSSMSDIQVVGVDVSVTSENQLLVGIQYYPVTDTSEITTDPAFPPSEITVSV